MRDFLMAAALSMGVAFSGVGMFAAPAQAQDLELRIDRNGPAVRLRDNCDPRYEDCSDRRDRRSERRSERSGCTEDRALDKAERMGVRRARISASGRRTIQVRGRDSYGERMNVMFSRERGCPVLR